MNHRLYSLKLACTAALNAAKDFLVQTCPPELDSGYTEMLDDDSEHIDLPLTPHEIDRAMGYRPMARTLEEAWPSANAFTTGENLRAPSHFNTYHWKDRVTMAAGVICGAATLALVIATQAPK